MKRIAIIGGGIAGLTAAYELARLARNGAQVEAVLFESSTRFGGLVETVREGGFTVEAGPDAWVSAKPWARDLAIELGLESELIASNDATRRTHIFLATPENPSGSLVPMPDGLNMMVPTNLEALEGSPLFTPAAIAAYRAEPTRAAELLASIPADDESVADFTLRHFGPEVLARVAAPLLSGVFGGDVRTLSVRAVMPAFVQMERQHGSLIAALQPTTQIGQPTAVFTTLRSGLGTLIDRLVAAIPPTWLRLNTAVIDINRSRKQDAESRKQDSPDSLSELVSWTVQTATAAKLYAAESFDAVFLATPLDATRKLLAPIDPASAELLPTESSSAVLVAFAYADASRVPIPTGFGFLVPPTYSAPSQVSARCATPAPGQVSAQSATPAPSQVSARSATPSPNQVSARCATPAPSQTPATLNEVASRYPRPSGLGLSADQDEMGFSPWGMPSPPNLLLACTFTDQKFPHRVPPNGRLIRAFFGGPAAERIARCNNDEIAAITRLELARILNAGPPITAAGPTPPPALTPQLPVLTLVRRWPNSLPQYAVGHPARIAELESRLRTLPGLIILGNPLHGVGVPDLIRAARIAARTAAGTGPSADTRSPSLPSSSWG